ncbi:MAG TPA: hypothetical protein VF247_10720 [Candidatus Krumholzibacteria bacterium]
MTARRGISVSSSRSPVVGVIDIGTNAVKLVVGAVKNGRVEVVHFGRRPTRLGKGLSASRRIRRDAIRSTATAVRELADEARAHGADDVVAVGTYALRAAENGREAARFIRRVACVPVRILSGTQEGELVLAAVRARLGRRMPRELMVVDVGGGSAQLCLARTGNATMVRSVPLGAVVLTENFLHDDPIDPVEYARLESHVELVVSRVFARLPASARAAGQLVVAGGAATTALRMLGVTTSARSLPRVPRADLQRIEMRCFSSTLAERRRFPGMTPDRADIMPAGLAVLIAFARHARSRSLRVFEGGWREGVILDRAERRAQRSRKKSGPTARAKAAARKGR